MNIIFLGTGSSRGTPEFGCKCAICAKAHERASSPLRRGSRTLRLARGTKNERTRSSIVVEHNGKNILIDPSPDFRQQVLDNNITHIDAVLVTHMHADHVLGIDDLASVSYKIKQQIPVYAPSEVMARLLEMFGYLFRRKNEIHYDKLVAHKIDTQLDLFGLRITPMKFPHGYGDFSYGYLFEWGGQRFAYISDALEIPHGYVAALTHLDLLILGTTRPVAKKHFNTDEAVKVCTLLKPKKAYFTHISHEVDHKQVSAKVKPIKLAYDGLNITI